MNNYELEFSPRFYDDYDDAIDYINNDLKNPIAANALIDETVICLGRIKDFPGIGFTPKYISAEYRFAICKGYLILYKFDNDRILIERFFHSSQDYVSILLAD